MIDLRELEKIAVVELKSRYTPDDLAGWFEYQKHLGDPGEPPFTRQIHETGYKTKSWTKRQFTGFGMPEQTNARFKKLIAEGEDGLSTAYSLDTLLGVDADHPLANGITGRDGVAVYTLEDMRRLFKGIDLSKISVSHTINATAIIIYAMFLAVAEEQGVDLKKLRGTIQNDPLKEYQSQNECLTSLRAAIKLAVDIMEFSIKNSPKYYPVSISGYHIREKGSSAIQEAAFATLNGKIYIEELIKRGLPIDEFASRLSHFYDAHIYPWLVEHCKFRAIRFLWADLSKNHFGAQNENSWKCRMHIQTAGCSLTYQQYLNNLARTALEFFGAVAAGIQSGHTNSYDEQECVPSKEAHIRALRIQQIIEEETGIADVIDPFGGAYAVEAITFEIVKKAKRYWEIIENGFGDMIEATEQGFIQREIERVARVEHKRKDGGQKIIVGVNKYQQKEPPRKGGAPDSQKIQKIMVERLNGVKNRRDSRKTKQCLEQIREAALANENLVPFVLEAVKNYTTVGEVSNIFKEVWGEYRKGHIL